ncbi:pentapeptide repeat-containing protein [Paraglaciecola sp. Hal342]
MDCKIHDVDFTQASLVKASFRGSELAHTRFHQSDLTKTDFSQAHGYQIDVSQNRVEKARFSRIEALGLLASLGIELVD